MATIQELQQNKGYQNLKAKGYNDNQIANMLQDYATKQGKGQQFNQAVSNLQNTGNSVQQNQPVNQPNTPQIPYQNQQNNVMSGTNVSGTTPTTVKSEMPTVQSQNQPISTSETPKTTTSETKKPAFGYQTTPEEREMRNNTIAQGLVNANQNFDYQKMFKQIVGLAPGVTTDEINQTVKDIESKYNAIKQNNYLLTTDSNSLLNDYNSGKLTDTQLLTLKNIDPNKYNEINQKITNENNKTIYNNILNSKASANGLSVDTTKEQTQDPFTKMTEMFNNIVSQNNLNYHDAYKIYNDVMNNGEVRDLQTKANDIQTQIDDIDEQMINLQKGVENKYKGVGLTQSQINALIGDESTSLQNKKNNLILQQNQTNRSLKTIADNAQANLEASLNEYQMQRQSIQDQLGQFSTMYGIYKDQREYQQAQQDRMDKINQLAQQQDFQKQMMEKEYDLKYGNINSDDPRAVNTAIDTAVTDIMNQYKGWTFTRSKAQMVGDIKKLVSEGKTLGQAIGENITGQLQANPNFQKYINQLTNPTNYVETKDANGNPILYNKNDPTQTYNIGGGTSRGTVGVGNTRAVKNNNPGNIKDTSFGNVIGTDDKGFAQFATLEEGFDALVQKIEGIQAGGSKVYTPNMTLLQFFQKYAPSADNNNPLAYSGSVAKALGVPMSTKIKDIDPTELAKQISKHEDGNAYNQLFNKETTSGTTTLSDDDISRFNSLSTGDANKLKGTDKQKYSEYIKQRSSIYSDPNAKTDDLLKYSQGGKSLDQSAIQTLQKFQQALGQITSISSDIMKTDTGPILGELKKINPYDTDSQVLKAKLQSLIPNLARGIYGEVGVLTDQDIVNYAKTVPNLTSTQDVNRGVLAMTLDTIAGGYKKNITSLARAGRDVSGYIGDLKDLQNQVDDLRQSIGLPKKYSIEEGTKQSSVNDIVQAGKTLYNLFWGDNKMSGTDFFK